MAPAGAAPRTVTCALTTGLVSVSNQPPWHLNIYYESFRSWLIWKILKKKTLTSLTLYHFRMQFPLPDAERGV